MNVVARWFSGFWTKMNFLHLTAYFIYIIVFYVNATNSSNPSPGEQCYIDEDGVLDVVNIFSMLTFIF